jgi:hypothetical protein
MLKAYCENTLQIINPPSKESGFIFVNLINEPPFPFLPHHNFQNRRSLLQFWIAEVEQSGIKEILSIVKSLKKNWNSIVYTMKTKITNAVS